MDLASESSRGRQTPSNLAVFFAVFVIPWTLFPTRTISAAELFYDSFEDSSTDLLPLLHVGERSIIDGSYALTPLANEIMFAAVNAPLLVDYSFETQVRATGRNADSSVFVIAGRDAATAGPYNAYFGGINGNGLAFIGETIDGQAMVEETVTLSINPVDSDLILRTDFVGNEVSFYAWEADEARPDAPVLTFSTDGRLKRGRPVLEFNPSSTFLPSANIRYVRVTGEEFDYHPLDVNFDTTSDVVDLDLICTTVARRRPDAAFDEQLDLNFDGALNAADVGTFLQEFGTMAGDLDLDGSVDFSDFTEFSRWYGRRRQQWTQGNFNCDQRVDFHDFLILASNFGSSSATVRSVPEPDRSITCYIAIALVALVRRRVVTTG